MFGPFHYAFVQRGALELVLLAVGAGVLGTWIVLRGLAFYSHGVATAAFPGLVLADGVGFAAPLGAFGAALLFAFGVERLGRGRRDGNDTLTALVLVGALALGVVLASDVFHSQANIETLLFGSVLAVGDRDLVLAAAVSIAALAAAAVLGGRWLAVGFDAGSARAIGVHSGLADALLLVVIALAVTSSLAAVGVMLAGALYVVPAATTRLWARTLRRWQFATAGLAALEGIGGLWLSVEVNVPPGAAIAVLAGGVFAIAALVRARVIRYALPAAAGVILLAGCGGSSNDHRPLVVATTTQIGDWVRLVGGDEIRVHQILQPNTDPHEYEPRPNDVIATAGALAVFANGLGLDDWIWDVAEKAGGQPLGVELGSLVRAQPKDDPHWWHDPRNAEAAVRVIRDVLIRIDPAHAERFTDNARRYESELQALDRHIETCFAQVPVADRKLVTSHDAFGYFARRYGVTIIGAVIPSQTTEAQPSAGDVARLIGLIKREHVKAIFPESSINSRLADQVARETGATSKYHLYGDTLGPQGTSGATYIAMERANADAMVLGFTGGAKHC